MEILVKQATKKIYYQLLARFIKVKLRAASQSCRSIEDYVDLAYDFEVRVNLRGSITGISPLQIKEETKGLLTILGRLMVKNILEIGTALGGTLFLFSKIGADHGKIISIDLPGGRFGAGYPEWRMSFYKSFAHKNQKIYLLRVDSHDISTVRKVKDILGGEELDFLFIDGDHAYEGVRKDFETYGRLVRKGGVIALHDIAPHPPETGCEVHKFWREIKNRYMHVEIVKDWNQGWAGIGVLFT